MLILIDQKCMPKWKQDAKGFKVPITGKKSSDTSFNYTLNPILNELRDPHNLKFLMTKGKIVVQSGN